MQNRDEFIEVLIVKCVKLRELKFLGIIPFFKNKSVLNNIYILMEESIKNKLKKFLNELFCREWHFRVKNLVVFL